MGDGHWLYSLLRNKATRSSVSLSKACGWKGIIMKTAEELYGEIADSKELQEEAKSQEEGEIEDDDVKAIAGGYHQSLLQPVIKKPV